MMYLLFILSTLGSMVFHLSDYKNRTILYDGDCPSLCQGGSMQYLYITSIVVVLAAFVTGACSPAGTQTATSAVVTNKGDAEIANPASQYCIDQGGHNGDPARRWARSKIHSRLLCQ